MTTAPGNLLQVRQLLIAHLNVDPKTVRAADLEPGEVGIVGDAQHRGGYHCGSDRLDAGRDYSVVESSRDKAGLSDYASALDVGEFTRGSHNLRTFSTWCVAQCAAGAADTADIREVIYSPDGRTVKRWDRLNRRPTGDDSHLTHTHFSFFRDSTKAGRDQTPLFRRYLTTIGLIEGDDMALTDAQAAQLTEVLTLLRRLYSGTVGEDNALTWWIRSLADQTDPVLRSKQPSFKPLPGPGLAQLGAQLAAVRADLAALAGRDLVDEEAIVAGVLAGLPADKIAAAIPSQMAKDVADELARRMVS